MDTIRTFSSPEIFSILLPTWRAFAPGILSNSAHITSIPSQKSIPYGPHPRQTLDIYTSASTTSPILIFLYGGGLTRGDKSIPLIPQNLAYANVGSFFAHRGFTTIIPDYRRVNDPREGTGEDAVFPSGGQDVETVIRWLLDSDLVTADGTHRELYIMGNSAGGVHLATYIFSPEFVESRKVVARGDKGVVLKGVIYNSVPMDFVAASSSRNHSLTTYFPPSKYPIAEYCPAGLLAAAIKSGKSKEELGIPERTMVLLGTHEPDDEIRAPVERWVEAWEKGWGMAGLERATMDGHNHISPPAALGSGDVEGERWGEELVDWMKSV